MFSLTSNFHIPRVCHFDFMVIIDFKIYKRFDRENRSGYDFTPLLIIHGQIPY